MKFEQSGGFSINPGAEIARLSDSHIRVPLAGSRKAGTQPFKLETMERTSSSLQFLVSVPPELLTAVTARKAASECMVLVFYSREML
jgi:hypothetical protein